jgi:hypothetical protein
MSDQLDRKADPLRRAAMAGRVEEVIRHLQGLAEGERKALRRALLPELQAAITALIEQPLALLPGAHLWQAPEGLPEIANLLRQRILPGRPEPGEDRPGRLAACRLAVVGLGSRTEVERALFSARIPPLWMDAQKPAEERFIYRAGLLILARPEPWRRTVLERLCAPNERWQIFATGSLDLGLHLLQTGVLSEDELLATVARTARMAGFYGLDWHDPLVLRLVWEALAARDEPSLASVGPGGFTKSLMEAVQDGRIERRPLMELALRRAAEATRSFETNWWVRLVEDVAPTRDEFLEHQEAALDLLGAPTARAVSLGVTAARELLAAGAVDPGELVPLLAAPLTCETAAAARGAVALLRRCATLAPAARVDALKTALGGLAHPKAAVHDAVLAWLEGGERWQEEPEIVFAARELLLRLPPAPAARLQRLLPDEAEPAPPAAPANQTDSLPAAVRRDLEGRLRHEPDPAVRAWLNACRAALDGRGPLPEPRAAGEPRWREAPPLALPQTPEETARLMLKASLGTLDEAGLEQILFGIRVPLAEGDSPRLRRLLDPMLRPAAEGVVPAWYGVPGRLDLNVLRRLAAAWLCSPGIVPPGEPVPCPLHIELRLAAAEAALARGEHAPPLCTPTNSLGWLAPTQFGDRVASRRRILPEEQFELSAALYRLAPGPEERQAAWEQISPVLQRFEPPVRLALAAALAPTGEADAAGARLAEWVVATVKAAPAVARTARRAVDFLSRLLAGQEATLAAMPALPERVPPGNYTSLRLLTAVMRCRHGLSPSVLVEQVLGAGAGEVFPFLAAPTGEEPDVSRFLAHPEPVTRAFAARLRGQRAAANPWGYLFHALDPLDRLFPELAPYFFPLQISVLAEVAFDFPLGAPRIVQAALAHDYDRYGRHWVVPALQLALRPDVQLRDPLPALLRIAALDDRSIQDAVAGVIVTGLRDGRLRCADLLAAFPPALADPEQRPRALVGILQGVANEGGAFREAAAACLERAVASGIDSLTGGERVILLEALLAWRSAAGRAVEDPEAMASLERLANKGKSTRTAALARQLVELAPDGPELASGALTCAAHDVRAMLEQPAAGRPATGVAG